MKKVMMNTLVTLVFLLAGILPVRNENSGPDSLRVTATGENNRLIINNAKMNSAAFATDSLNLSGEISQTGINNSVEIETANNTHHLTKSKQATTKKKHETCNMQHVTISQTGKNNSVKINSR